MSKLIEKVYELLGEIATHEQCAVVAVADEHKINIVGAGTQEMQLKSLAELTGRIIGTIAQERASEDKQDQIFLAILMETTIRAMASFQNMKDEQEAQKAGRD